MNSNKKAVWTTFGAVALVGIIAAGVWAYRVHSHRQYVNSLSDSPGKVIDASLTGKISDQERDDALRNALEANMGKQLDDYFALPSGAQRTAYLDKRIDAMEDARKMMQSNGPTTQPALREAIKAASTQPEGVTVTKTQNGNNQKVMVRVRGGKNSMESLPPGRRAQLAEFMADMNKRRAARGLSDGSGAGPIVIRVEHKEGQ